eukprot:22630-Hanusia_phi.AAC.3
MRFSSSSSNLFTLDFLASSSSSSWMRKIEFTHSMLSTGCEVVRRRNGKTRQRSWDDGWGEGERRGQGEEERREHGKRERQEKREEDKFRGIEELRKRQREARGVGGDLSVDERVPMENLEEEVREGEAGRESLTLMRT